MSQAERIRAAKVMAKHAARMMALFSEAYEEAVEAAYLMDVVEIRDLLHEISQIHESAMAGMIRAETVHSSLVTLIEILES